MIKLRWHILDFLLKNLKYYQKIHQYIILIYKKENKNKIFCIGFVKTGTTSLYKALNILGYRTVRLLDLKTWNKKGPKQYVKQISNWKYDAFVDFPMGFDEVFVDIEKEIPNSKFILTTRDIKKWQKSYFHHFDGSGWQIKTTDDIKKRTEKMEKHNNDVIKYFKNKPNKLLIMDITKGDGWEKLCKFLNKPIPNQPFPHKNIGKYRKK